MRDYRRWKFIRNGKVLSSHSSLMVAFADAGRRPKKNYPRIPGDIIKDTLTGAYWEWDENETRWR